MTAQRATGFLTIGAAVLIVIGMGLHPSNAEAVTLGNTVHGMMISMLLLSYWGVIQFLRPRGLSEPLISAGLVAYSVWLVAQLIAATINGFAVPALAGAEGNPVGADVFLLAWELNQGLVKVGFFAAGAALVLWSLRLLCEEAGPSRALALFGLVAGLVPPILLLAGVPMNTRGALIAYGIHALWIAAVGGSMFSKREGIATAAPERAAAAV